jgi:hypothetical protein
MASLLTRDLVKTRLGLELDDDTYDVAIDAALPVVTAWFEEYCCRGLAFREITDEELFDNRNRRIYVWAFPISVLTSVDVDGVLVDGASYVVNSKAGYFMPGSSRGSVEYAELLKITYDGGYAAEDVPDDLADAFANAVGVQAAVAGVTASTGGSSAIKSIGLGGGALSVAFDTGTVSGGTSGTYDVSNAGPEVQSYASTLDRYSRMRV